MKETIFLILGLALATLGVICLYDARGLTKKFFGFGDQNEATLGLKILGFVLAMVGALVIYFR